MGTVVFPDAFLKLFLQASPKVRAQRRYKQLKEKGFDVNLSRLENEIAERDYKDTHRAVSPLAPADNAVVIDTSHKSREEVLSESLAMVRARLGQ
jgi:cytidylate kinase